MPPTLLIPDATRSKIDTYAAALRHGSIEPGSYLTRTLEDQALADLTSESLLPAMLDTKVPQIFAESTVAGDGSDWNLTELGILGDLSIAVDVTIYDNGRHADPGLHPTPLQGMLVFTPGALLRNGCGQTSADWNEVTDACGQLDPVGFQALYERRLLPVFEHIDAQAMAVERQALITIPGLGCGQFAGPFIGKLGKALKLALEGFLKAHGKRFKHIQAIYYDPYNECANERSVIDGIDFMVRPLAKGNSDKPQLCTPTDYQEDDDDFSNCELFSIVAWDHVSWPGNDFFGGSRCTDDGVKAAATDSMFRLTGIEGSYDASRHAYLPPRPHSNWASAVKTHDIRLSSVCSLRAH